MALQESGRRLCVFLALVVLPSLLCGQEPTTDSPTTGQASAQQPASSNPSAGQTSASATPSPDTALDDPVLEEADEEQSLTYMRSHVTFKYNHDEYDQGSSSDRLRIAWLQSFGAASRMAAGIELPFVHFEGGNNEPSGNGVGDIKLQFKGMLGKGEKFEHAAGIETTTPSASNEKVGDRETVIRVAWGFTGQITRRTLLSGELGYNKAVHARQGLPSTNDIEPELILVQGFAKRTSGYLDWDTYYDFNASEYAQTLKAGLNIELGHRDKWNLSPSIQFPLNHFTRATTIKSSMGVELRFNF